MASIFGEIEKLINEHGSANILRERLALAKEQYENLEKKFFDCQQENKLLLNRVKLLEEENNRLKQIVNRSSTQFVDFDDITHKVLKVFFEQSGDVSAEQVADRLEIEQSLVNYHFDLLREAKLIIPTTYETASSPVMYRITSAGRKYIVKNHI